MKLKLCLGSLESNEIGRSIAVKLGVCAIAHGALPEPVPFDNSWFDLVCLLDVLGYIERGRSILS